MTGNEILQAIQQLPPSEQRALMEQLQQELPVAEATDDLARREREFELEMLAAGFFASIPDHSAADSEDDEYEPPESAGEPLSEQIVRERI